MGGWGSYEGLPRWVSNTVRGEGGGRERQRARERERAGGRDMGVSKNHGLVAWTWTENDRIPDMRTRR